RDFGVTERIQRKHETVESYQELEGIIREEYGDISMTGKYMYDFKGHLGLFFKKSTTRVGLKYSISKYKVFGFSADFKSDIEVSDNMSSVVTTRFRLLTPNVRAVTYPEQALYSEKLPVKAAKVSDVRKLARYLSLNAQTFIED
ncbi:hypothetical protein LSAT2_008994, partial [Lamellibrachia satsuma]